MVGTIIVHGTARRIINHDADRHLHVEQQCLLDVVHVRQEDDVSHRHVVVLRLQELVVNLRLVVVSLRQEDVVNLRHVDALIHHVDDVNLRQEDDVNHLHDVVPLLVVNHLHVVVRLLQELDVSLLLVDVKKTLVGRIVGHHLQECVRHRIVVIEMHPHVVASSNPQWLGGRQSLHIKDTTV